MRLHADLLDTTVPHSTTMNLPDEIVGDRKLGNITPKLHLLERHVVGQMRHFGTGLGLIGEYGAESIHAELNLLAATFDAVPRELDLLAVIAKQH